MHVVDHAHFHFLARELERFLVDVDIFLRDFHLAGGSLQIEVGAADVALDLAFQVFVLGAALAERGVGLLNVALGAAALPDWNFQAGRGRVRRLQLAGVDADAAVVGGDSERGVTLGAGSGVGAFGGAHLCVGGFQIGALLKRLRERVFDVSGAAGAKGTSSVRSY